MHLVVFHELQRMHANSIVCLERIVPEQNVLLECLHGNCEREGRFDFLVGEKNGKTIGFEILSRPSQGKMKQKLSYAKEVDEFVFVVPSNSLELYLKKPKKPFKNLARQKFFSKEFSEKKISVWLLDIIQGVVEKKALFSEIFAVSANE
jgi:hypothetical protein